MTNQEVSSLKNYPSTMYSNGNHHLKTGDVVSLQLKDFKKIARHESMIGLFKQYEEDEQYSRRLWTVLNKSCDMVHDKENKRFFKSNLFLSPLQGLRNALIKGTLGKIIYLGDIPDSKEILIKAYRSFLKKKNLKKEDVTEIIKKIETIFHEKEKSGSVSQLLNYLIEYTLDHSKIKENLKEFKESDIWSKAVNSFDKKKKENVENNNIILKKDAKDKLARLCLNQLDSQGIFYYEPTKGLSDSKHDLSYIIQLEDMITLKIKESVQKSGELVELLRKNRIISLTENFSDRLLNIIGNFFSKIGTDDVMSDKILELYFKTYPDSFFTDKSSFDSYRG